jgi:hypothetical protein
MQEHPNQLRHAPFGEPVRVVSRGTAAVLADGQRVTRLPSGHPEGYLEAFATLYAEIAQAIRAARSGDPIPAGVAFPTLEDGIHGLAFIEAAVRSSADGGRWVRL